MKDKLLLSKLLKMEKGKILIPVFGLAFMLNFIPGLAQTISKKAFQFSNSLENDSVMLMASWWNSKVKTLTYEAWIKPEESDLSFDGHRTRAVVYKQHYGTSGIYLGNYSNGTSVVKVVVPGTTTQWSITKLPRLKDKEWNYVAMVVDGNINKVTVWINDQKCDSIFTVPLSDVNFWAGHMPGGDGNLAQVRPVTIGGQWPYYPGRTTMMPAGRKTVDRFFRGEIDELRIWNVARKDEEIIANQNRPLSGAEEGLLAYYNFDSVSVSNDSLINLKTGKLDCSIWGLNIRSGLKKSYALISPQINSPVEVLSTGFQLTWNLISGVESYYPEIAVDSTFLYPISTFSNLKVDGNQNSVKFDVRQPGTYYFRVKAGDASGNSISQPSDVKRAVLPVREVKSITLTSENGSLSISHDMGKLRIIANVVSDGITDNTVRWSVDNATIGRVDQTGMVTANANGKLRITATSLFTPTVSGSITLDISNQAPDIWEIPVVKYPSPVYWGGYKHMAQLTEPGAAWDFVKQNMDGFLYHGAYWANVSQYPEVPEVAAKLSQILNPYKKKNLAELGWPGTYLQFQPTPDMALKKAQGHVKSLNNFKSWGINIDEINIDWHMYLWKPLCIKHPEWTEKDITDWVTGDFDNYTGPATIYKPGYFPDYVNTIRKSYPQMTFYVVDSPVWFWWDDYPSLGKSENNQRLNPLTTFDPVTGVNTTTSVLVNGQPVSFLFNWHEIMQGIFNSSGNNGVEGLGSDYPYDYVQWSDPVAREICFNKVLNYEKWFHSVNKKHTLICNTSDGDRLFPSDKDAWDKHYYEKSLVTLINYQKRGGRADRYLFESWYSGPFVIVPETQKYTFTNLVKEAISFIKGVNQKLDLQIRKTGDGTFTGTDIYQPRPDGSQNFVNATSNATESYVVRLKNSGDATCYPMLKALKRKSQGWNVMIIYNSTDITASVFSADGYTFPDLLSPGAFFDIQVSATASSQITPEKDFGISFWAFWNPQDPTNTIRDAISISQDFALSNAEETQVIPEFLIYPNPSTGNVNFDLRNLDGEVTLKIFDIKGVTVFEKKLSAPALFNLDTRLHCLKGVYSVAISGNQQVFFEKLVVK